MLKVEAQKINTVPGEIQSEISQFFIDARSKKLDKNPVAKRLGSRMGIHYRTGSWLITNIAVDLDDSTKVTLEMEPNTYIKATRFKGRYFNSEVLEYSPRLTVKLSSGGIFNRSGVGKVHITLYLSLTPEEAFALCGESKPETFKVASSFWSLFDKGFKDMYPYENPKKIKTRAKTQKTNIIVRLLSGQLIFLPPRDVRDSVEKEQRNSFDPQTNTFITELQNIKNDLIYWNLDQGKLTFVSTNGQTQTLPLSGSAELSKSATLTALTSPFENTAFKFGKQSPKEDLNKVFSEVLSPEDIAKFSMFSGSTPELYLEALEKSFSEKEVVTHLDTAKKWVLSNTGVNEFKHPLRRYSLVAIIELMKQYTGKVKNLKDEIEAKVQSMRDAGIADAPTLPDNFDKDIQFFPHQADAAAKGSRADDTLILDVATGGGKTLLFIVDILNLMQGDSPSVLKPLLVIPTNLAPQWFNEINDFTNGSINPVLIFTETVKNESSGGWGKDKLETLIRTAPRNSIFITTYDWIKLGGVSEKVGGTVVHSFPNVDWLHTFNFDYVGLDELHTIKNTNSKAHQACMALRTKIKYKRGGTGTITPNNRVDIVGQMRFIDPAVFGTKKDFLKDFFIGGDEKMGLMVDADERIQSRLATVGLISKTRKDWFYCLPKIKEDYHIVNMSSNQKTAYEGLITNFIDEVMADPNLRKAWEELKLDPDADTLPIVLLAKLKEIEAFSSDPANSRIGKGGGFSGDDLHSPKMPKILEILDDHFSKTPDEKVLIFTQFRQKVIGYVYDNLGKYRKDALLYASGMRANIERFKNDPKIKILVACNSGLRLGHNLQMASRMIMLDVWWSPGDMDQILARIYRIDKREGAIPRENIFVDWVLAEGTIDVLKFRRTIRKMIGNAKMMQMIPQNSIPELPPIIVGEDTLLSESRWVLAQANEVQQYSRFRELEGEQWEELRKTQPIDQVDIKTDKAIEGSKIDVPWPEGANIPGDYVTVDEAVDLYAKGNYKKLVGHKCITQFGSGVIGSLSPRRSLNDIRMFLTKYTEDDPDAPNWKVYTKKKMFEYVREHKIDLKSVISGYNVKIAYEDGKDRGSIVGTLVGVEESKAAPSEKFNITVPGTALKVGEEWFWLTEEGLIYSTKGLNIGKLRYVYSKGEWLGRNGQLAPKSKFTKKIKQELDSKLKKVGIKVEEVAPPQKVLTIKGQTCIMTVEGKIHKLSISSGKILKPFIFYKNNQWVDTNDRAFKANKRTLDRWTQYLKELGYDFGAIPIKETPIVKKKKLKRPYGKSTIKPIVTINALNFAGITALSVHYNLEDNKLINMSLKGNKFKPLSIYRLPITPAIAKRVMVAISKKKLSVNKSIIPLIQNAKKANLLIKNLPPKEIKELIALIKKNWITNQFFMYPVINNSMLELWIIIKRPQVIKKFLPVINVLKFTEETIMFRWFATKGLISQAATFAVSALKAKKITIANEKTLKQEIALIKKQTK